MSPYGVPSDQATVSLAAFTTENCDALPSLHGQSSPYTHNRSHTARSRGRGMGCLLRVQITTRRHALFLQYWITNTKQACMGSDAICVPYLLLLLPSGFDLITEPEVLIGVWSRAHPVCDRAALSVDKEITTRGSGKVACKGIHPAWPCLHGNMQWSFQK